MSKSSDDYGLHSTVILALVVALVFVWTSRSSLREECEDLREENKQLQAEVDSLYSDESTSRASDLYQDGYNDGYSDASRNYEKEVNHLESVAEESESVSYNSGYKTGYDEGFRNGYDEAAWDAYSKCLDDYGIELELG